MIALLLSLLLTTFGVTRAEDPALSAIAADRVAYQIAYSGGECLGDGSLTHDGVIPWTGEVLACNFTADPARAVQQWANSPPHAMVLSVPDLTRIGCAHDATPNGHHWWVCVLAYPAEPAVPAPPTPPPAPANALPDTAIPHP